MDLAPINANRIPQVIKHRAPAKLVALAPRTSRAPRVEICIAKKPGMSLEHCGQTPVSILYLYSKSIELTSKEYGLSS